MSALSQLDPNEVLAVRENLESAKVHMPGPPARVVPEGLCDETVKLLTLLELEIRIRQMQPPHA